MVAIQLSAYIKAQKQIIADLPEGPPEGPVELVIKYALRTLDAVQLAGVLHAVPLVGLPITFLCADKHLLTAAAAEGF